MLLSGLHRKAWPESFNSYVPPLISFPHTPAKKIWGAKGLLTARGPIGVCQSLFPLCARRSRNFLLGLVGYMMVCLSLLHPTNGEVSSVPTIPFLIPTFHTCTSRTFSRSGLAGPVFMNVPAARPSRLTKVKREVTKVEGLR